MSDESYFASLLKEFRKSKGTTQLQLQTRLEGSGYTIDSTTLSKYESGERRPSAEFIPFFVKALGLSAKDEQALLEVYVKDFELSTIRDYQRGKSHVGL